MIVKAQGSSVEVFSLGTDVYNHNLVGQTFSLPAGVAQFYSGRDILIKKARLVVIGLRFPRRSISSIGATIISVGNSVDNIGPANFTIVDLEEWIDINATISAPAGGANYQIEILSTPNPQQVFIDSRGISAIYNGQNILCELQLEIEAKTA